MGHGSPRHHSPADAGPHRPGGPGHSPRPRAVSMTVFMQSRFRSATRRARATDYRSGTVTGEPPRPPDTATGQGGSFGPGHSTSQQPAAPCRRSPRSTTPARRHPAPTRAGTTTETSRLPPRDPGAGSATSRRDAPAASGSPLSRRRPREGPEPSV